MAMGYTDRHQQLENYYTVQQSHFRNWWPLFFFLINAIIVNTWVFLRIHKKAQLHRDVHQEIAIALITERLQELQLNPVQHPSTKPPMPEVPPTTSSHILQRNVNGSKKDCVVCIKNGVRSGRIRKQRKCKALGEISSNRRPRKHAAVHPSQTRFECRACRVALCKKGKCWTQHHRK